MQVYQENTGLQVGFIEWMSWAVPLVVILVPFTALWLTRHCHSVLDIELPAVGRWRLEEKRVMIVFAFTALAWITRKEPFGGWSGFLDLPKANDASVALLAVILLFVIPNGKGGRLLNWEAAVTIPWGMLLLFGGGICLAKAFVVSGLSQVLGASLGGLTALPLLLTLLCLTLAVSFLTETTSNTASTTLLMPILAAAALAVNIDPLLLMVPAAMSASCAFMLPVATAPNTIVFGSQCFTTKEMAHEGFVLNVIAALLISLWCWMVLT
jgi:sodium-dependent dicarboxylate transporter 2/3/5